MDRRRLRKIASPARRRRLRQTCGCTYSTPTGPVAANDQNVYTAAVGVSNR